MKSHPAQIANEGLLHDPRPLLKAVTMHIGEDDEKLLLGQRDGF